MLDTVCSNKTPVSIEHIDSPLILSGFVTAVNSDTRQFFLQVDSDLADIQKIDEGMRANLYTTVNNVKVFLRQMSLDYQGADRGAIRYSAPIPEFITYYQRRDVFRASVSDYMEIPINIYAANTYEFGQIQTVPPLTSGDLKDISVEGCAIETPQFDIESIKEFSRLIVLELDLADYQEPFALFAELRHSTDGRSMKRKIIGLEFTGNDRKTQRELGLLVTKIQLMARSSNVLSA